MKLKLKLRMTSSCGGGKVVVVVVQIIYTLGWLALGGRKVETIEVRV